MPRCFVLVTQGTMGDLNPFLYLSEGLRKLDPSTEIHILTNENFKVPVKAYGAEFHPICPANKAQDVKGGMSQIEEFLATGYRNAFATIAEIRQRSRIDAVVALSVCRGAEAACEQFGIRFLRISLQPYAISSTIQPSYPQRFFTTPPLRILNPGGVLVKAMNWRDARKIRPSLNRFRESVGLTPKRDINDMNGARTLNLGMFPDWFAPRQDDWPTQFRACGFPNFSQFDCCEDDLAQFIDGKTKPIVFFPGSGVIKTEAFVDTAKQISASLGRAAIVIDRNLRQRGTEGNIFFENRYCDLGSVLRNAGAIFHHGGIGTTSDALRAGIPQFIVPRIYDQLDNGMRIRELGVGDVIYPHFAFNAKTVSPMFDSVVSRYQTHEKLEKLSRGIAEDDRRNIACEEILCASESRYQSV